MKVVIYDSNGNQFRTIDKAIEIISCSDGRHLITTTEICSHCNSINKYITQVPAGYKVEVKDGNIEEGEK